MRVRQAQWFLWTWLAVAQASADMTCEVKELSGQAVQAATDALVFEAIDGLTLRDVEVDWDREKPEPKWGSALVLRDVSNLILQDFRGQAGRPDGSLPAVRREGVTERPAGQ